MAPNGVKREVNFEEVRLRSEMRARVTGLEEELAAITKELAIKAQELKVNGYKLDLRKDVIAEFKAQNLLLQQARAQAQQELNVCQEELNQCESKSARAEKALASLTADMNQIEELTHEMRGLLTKELEGITDFGGFEGVLYVLHAVQYRLKHDSGDHVTDWHPETPTMKQVSNSRREKVGVEAAWGGAVGELDEEKTAVDALQLLRRADWGSIEQETGNERENEAASEVGFLRRELEKAKLKEDSHLEQVRAAQEHTEEAIKLVGKLTEGGAELQQKLKDERDAAVEESERLRASLESALERHTAMEGQLKGLTAELAEGGSMAASGASILRRGLERAEKTVEETAVQLGKNKDTIAALREDLQRAEGEKEAAEQRVLTMGQKMWEATQMIREAGETFAKDKKDLERELSEAKERTIAVERRLHKQWLAQKVVESEVGHKLAQKDREIAEIREQLHMVQEVSRTQVAVAQVRAEQAQQWKPPKKRFRNENWLTLGSLYTEC